MIITVKRKTWNVDTKLDACDTTMTKNQDGTLTFSNTIRADSFRNERNDKN